MEWVRSNRFGFAVYTSGTLRIHAGTEMRRNRSCFARKGQYAVHKIWNLFQDNKLVRSFDRLKDAKQAAEELVEVA